MPKTSRGGKAGATTANTASGSIGTARFQFHTVQQKQAQATQEAQQAVLDTEDVNVRYAVRQYIRRDTQANGFSRSQNLNNKLEVGGKLDQTEKFMVKNLDAAMRPFGSATSLVRGDHAITPQGTGLMQRLGVASYQNMTPAQLSKALTGKTWTEAKYLSTSINVSHNPFLSGSQAGGRSVIWRISAGGSVRTVVGDKTQTEQILARGGNYRITGARFTGQTVYPRQGGSYRQIEIDVVTV